MKNLEQMMLIELDEREMKETNGGSVLGALALLVALAVGALVGVYIKSTLPPNTD